MTGRYVLYVFVDSLPDERRFDAGWRRFAEICRSLHRDGLNYDVQLRLDDAKPHVLITASGTAVPRKLPAARRYLLPQPIPPQRCSERAQEAAWFLPEYQSRRKDGTAYWRRHRTRYEELSAMAEDLLRAELEYWHELETLSRQRDHFKPGRTDETAHLDDEVLAA
jgi:hypothetical protein